ncbi:MAG: dienelactone hydrolase family protein [Acidimicrobiia bacterium]
MARDLAYFIQDGSTPRPGVLLLHSFWGLTSSVKALADGLADEGYTVLAPDINFGEVPETEPEAVDHLGNANPDRLASLVLSSAQLLQEKSSEPTIAAVGFGMGGSMALWASVRLNTVIDRVVSFYGTQQIDFAGSRSRYLVHLAESDGYITEDETAFMEATMGLESLDVGFYHYPGTHHGFGDPDGDTFDPDSFDLAWKRTVEFLRN